MGCLRLALFRRGGINLGGRGAMVEHSFLLCRVLVNLCRRPCRSARNMTRVYENRRHNCEDIATDILPVHMFLLSVLAWTPK